jgi:hypothetical protein
VLRKAHTTGEVELVAPRENAHARRLAVGEFRDEGWTFGHTSSQKNGAAHGSDAIKQTV